MKAIALLALLLVASCTAEKYTLKCSRNELGVLWPDYDNSAQYYHCLNIGNPVIMKCTAGTLFTFVYQSCTLQSEYIPPPELKNLPTDAPAGGITNTTISSETAATTPSFTLPTPLAPQTNAPGTTKTTAAPTTKTTTVASETTTKTTTEKPTTTAKPTTTTVGGPTPPTPAGVPNPPSPAATGVPMPNTPAATPPIIDVAPPNAAPTVKSN